MKLRLNTKRELNGWIFVAPFVIWFILFFLYPLYQSILFSFSELEITPGGFKLHPVGWQNYYKLLFENVKFRQVFVNTMIQTLSDLPLILIFSFFAANLLNQQFRGRFLARVIFFLPVIIGAQTVMQIQSGDFISGMMRSANLAQDAGLFSGLRLEEYLYQMKLPLKFTDYIMTAVNHLPAIINASGIQILIFLAALQSIPSSLYEAAKMEGATAWEYFWKITFPLISPMMLTNIVYTLVDSFTAHDNALVKLIRDTAWSGGGAGYGVSVAMSWFYFASIAFILIIILSVLSRSVFYRE
ncbi:MAG TPA: sugar ABC transporter permease [Limnochordia bacterium]|nr:sugar ABC transporter permease [Limnochordia bacterium]